MLKYTPSFRIQRGGPVNLTPFAAFEPSWLMQEGYSETGAATLGLGYAKSTTRAMPATLGWVYNFADTPSLSPFFTSPPGSTVTVRAPRATANWPAPTRCAA
jgi:uncharacterized protein with beta-barrel porin domain